MCEGFEQDYARFEVNGACEYESCRNMPFAASAVGFTPLFCVKKRAKQTGNKRKMSRKRVRTSINKQKKTSFLKIFVVDNERETNFF